MPTSLMHHLNQVNLRRAFQSLDGNKAVGIDHVTKSEYERNLDQNLQSLEQTLRGGGWRPKPAREVLIPKPQGGMRPLAIGCLEDKLVQTAMARILEAIYEPHFHRHSYGFRRGKSAHQALIRTHEVIRTRHKSCVVVEMDIEKFFDSVDHDWLIRTLELRISDPHFLRLIKRLMRNSTLHADGKMTNDKAGPAIEADSSGVFRADMRVWSVPLEVTTNFRLFYLLSLYGGVGYDWQFGGTNKLDMSLNSKLIGTSPQLADKVDVGTAKITATENVSPSSGKLRALVGVQANLAFIRVFTHLNVMPDRGLLGVVTGVRLAF